MFAMNLFNKIAFTSLAFLTGLLHADTLVFNNGDRLSGTLISEEDGQIVFNSDLLGDIVVPQSQATVATAETETDPASNVEAIADSTTPQLPSAPADAEPDADSENEQDMFNASLDRAKDYIQSIVPDGWEGKVNVGLMYTQNLNDATQLNTSLKMSKESGPHSYSGNLFYNYNSTTNNLGVKNTTTDQYGAGFSYRYAVSDRWYVESDTSYLSNRVKQIRHQATENISVGYYFIKEEDFTFSLAPGIAGQYNDVAGEDRKWIGFGTLQEDLFYRFDETFNVEQNAYVRYNPWYSDELQYGFNAALNADLNEWVTASLVYTFTYDGTVGPGAQKDEQIIAFQLGFPF